MANRVSVSLIIGTFLFTMGLSGRTVSATDEVCFTAQLVWGTDREKPKDPNLPKVDPKLVERFRGVFKWEHYYRVSEKEFCVPAKKTKKIELSDDCQLQVRDLGQPMVEVKLFRDGKLVNKTTQAAIKCLVIAGDDKNDTAWFVVLIPQ